MPSARDRAAELTALGGFAVWQVGRSGLLPLRRALEPALLAERFDATRAGLATGTGLRVDDVPHRTAVSAAQIGLVSRFWSVALASLALHGWVPDLTTDRVLVDRSHRNPSPMTTVEDTGRTVDRAGGSPAAAAAAVADLVLSGAVQAVTTACATHGRTAPRVLVSNAASALVSTARVLGATLPHRAGLLDATARLLLQDPWLAEGGSYRPGADSPPDGGDRFRRDGCCLYYRLPGHGLCPDCVLVREPG